MVARPARRLDPAPAAPAALVAQDTPFADAALELRNHGLAPIPLGGDDGKAPVGVRFGNWKVLPGRQFLEQLVTEHPTANVGILTGLFGHTVVDIDDPNDPELVDAMLARFGDTPLIIGTPSGGVHLWYRSNGERCRVRLDGLKVDIRGKGGMVAVPPSIRPTGQHAGKAYVFLKGSWDDLVRLPAIKPAERAADQVEGKVYDGERSDRLFSFLMHQIRACDTQDDLLDVGVVFGDNCIPPLPHAKVVKAVRSVWRYEAEGKNWVGGPARAVFTVQNINRLAVNPHAFVFLAKLQVTHGGRREPFTLDARAMHLNKVMPGWSRNRYMAATNWLVEAGYLVRVHQGGKKGLHDTSLYVLPIRS